MIKECIPDITASDHYSAKISAYLRAYGTKYDFCRFYSGNGFTAMLFNSSLTVSGIPENTDEFENFIAFLAPYTIESSLSEFTGYSAHEITLFRGRTEYCGNAEKISSVYEMSELVSRLLGVDRELWYTDMSHRIRHGISAAYKCGGSYAAADFIYNGYAYISSVVSPENERNKGNIKAIFSEISKSHGIYVLAEPELYGFYEHIGLKAEKKQYLLIRQG